MNEATTLKVESHAPKRRRRLGERKKNYSCDKFLTKCEKLRSNNHKQWHNHLKVISDVVICFVIALMLPSAAIVCSLLSTIR